MPTRSSSYKWCTSAPKSSPRRKKNIRNSFCMTRQEIYENCDSYHLRFVTDAAARIDPGTKALLDRRACSLSRRRSGIGLVRGCKDRRQSDLVYLTRGCIV